MKQRRYPVNGRGPEGEDGGPGEGEGEIINRMGRGRRTLPSVAAVLSFFHSMLSLGMSAISDIKCMLFL